MLTDNREILHLCDFDGTLTKGDTLLHFLWFALSPSARLKVTLLAPIRFTGLLFTGSWSNDRAKEQLLSLCFKGKTRVELEKSGEAFCQEVLPGLIRSSLLETLLKARGRQERVVIVSASLDIWIKPFCQQEGFEWLCTELEYKKIGAHGAPQFSGYFGLPNCNRAEKARRIQMAYSLSDFRHIIAYGNSKGDYDMYALANEVVRF
jgi:HAD superfamily phosphoserine phosphatase-like hydrolase